MSIYVGNGHKYEEISYFPVNPPEVKNDPVEYDTQPEPTPLHEPVAVVEEKAPEDGENEGDPDGEGEWNRATIWWEDIIFYYYQLRLKYIFSFSC